MKKLTIISSLALATVALSHGQTIVLSDDFALTSNPDGTSTASIAAWDTENGVNAGTSFSAFDDGGASANYFSTTTALNVSSTVWNNTSDGWDVSFTFALDAGTASISLTTLDLSAIVTNNSGVARSGGGDREWTFELTGDDAYGTQSASVISNFTNASPTGEIDLSGLGNLVAGENYTASIGVRYVSGDNTYMALDSMTINGNLTPVPEPSAFGLLAGCFGLTWVMLRRRS